jgi:curved DNA-binding protein CbpA
MSKQVNRSASKSSDPRAVLGIGQDVSDAEIRSAYLRKIKEFPPDRHPIEFELVRDAYDLLRDRRQRVRHSLLSIDPCAPLESLFDQVPGDRKYCGPEPWLAVLKGK